MSYFTGKNLLTMDWKKTFPLLENYNKQAEPELDLLHSNVKQNQRLLAVKGLLSKEECKTIISKCKEHTMQDMGNTVGYDRDNSRLVVLDERFADLLWSRLESPVTDFFTREGITLYPRGFDVAKGKWEFCGINNAMRFNQYESKRRGMFGPHRDAQYCPSGDERSMLSLVIYLNDGFSGGSTNFYFEKDPEKKPESKGMSMQEELKINGGLENGYDFEEVKPFGGDAVIFNQDIIHESTPLIHKKSNLFKYVIKTDIVLRRVGSLYGFSVSPEEKEDYMDCLDLFRSAQQKEMDEDEDESSTANELYEKSLSIRYFYPTPSILDKWKHINFQTTVIDSNDNCSSTPLWDTQSISQESIDNSIDGVAYLFPAEVWMNIMLYLPEDDLTRLIKAFKILEPIKRKVNELRCVVPRLIYNRGVFSHFVLDSADFVNSNVESCCRVLAVYSVFLIGNSVKSDTYAVRYDDVKNEVLTISLNKLLKDVFHGSASYGVVMKVMQKGDEKNPEEDLKSSVDKKFMSDMFGKKSFGCDRRQITRTECVDQRVEVDDEESERETEYGFFPKDGGEAGTLNFFDRLYTLDGESISDYYDSDDEVVRGEPVEIDYDEGLEETTSGRHVGAAIVRSLREAMILKASEFCVCGIGGYKDNNDLTIHCDTEVFNHLIADFRKHKFAVKESNSDVNCCPFKERLSKKVRRDEKGKWLGELRCFSVDITPLNNADLSFQHASCNCFFYDYEIVEYKNVRSYPYLDHVHVILHQDGDKMMAWTSYGGVSAL